MTLKHRDDLSFLEFEDINGEPKVAYHGTEENSIKALKLVSHLCGLKIDHLGLMILAGRQISSETPEASETEGSEIAA